MSRYITAANPPSCRRGLQGWLVGKEILPKRTITIPNGTQCLLEQDEYLLFRHRLLSGVVGRGQLIGPEARAGARAQATRSTAKSAIARSGRTELSKSKLNGEGTSTYSSTTPWLRLVVASQVSCDGGSSHIHVHAPTVGLPPSLASKQSKHWA